MRGPATLLVVALLLGAAAGCLSVGSTSDGAAGSGADAPTKSGPPDSGNESAEGSDPHPAPANGSDGTSDPSQTGGSPVQWAAWGCEETFSMTEVPKAWAARHTPEGFEPKTFVPPSALGVPIDRTAKASFLVNSAHCDKVTRQGLQEETTVEDANQVTYGVFVDPPEAYRSEGVKLYVYPFRIVAGTPERVSMLRAADLPAETGQVELSTHRNQDPRSWTVTAESSNVTMYRFDIGTIGEEQAWEEPEVFRFFGQATDGSVTHALDREVQPNTTQSPLIPMGRLGSASSYELVAPDAPGPGPIPSLVTNVKMTPADKVAKYATVVSFPGQEAGT